MPTFAHEAAQRQFRESHDSADFPDCSKAQPVCTPHLKATITAISLRLPVRLLERIKIAAHKCDVPYQSLIMTWPGEKFCEVSSLVQLIVSARAR